MAVLSTLLAVVSILTAILLTIVILMQNPKHSGGLGAIGGGVSEAMFGASASTALVKITVWLAVIFLVATLGNASIIGHMRRQSSVGEQLVQEMANAPAAVPAAQNEVPAAPAAPAAK